MDLHGLAIMDLVPWTIMNWVPYMDPHGLGPMDGPSCIGPHGLVQWTDPHGLDGLGYHGWDTPKGYQRKIVSLVWSLEGHTESMCITFEKINSS